MSGNSASKSESITFVVENLDINNIIYKMNPEMYETNIFDGFSWIRENVSGKLANFLGRTRYLMYSIDATPIENSTKSNNSKANDFQGLQNWYNNCVRLNVLEYVQISTLGAYINLLRNGYEFDSTNSVNVARTTAYCIMKAAVALPVILIKESATIILAPIYMLILEPLYYLGIKPMIKNPMDYSIRESDKVDDIKENFIKNYFSKGLFKPLYRILYKTLTIPYDILSMPYIGYFAYKASQIPEKYRKLQAEEAAKQEQILQTETNRSSTRASATPSPVMTDIPQPTPVIFKSKQPQQPQQQEQSPPNKPGNNLTIT